MPGSESIAVAVGVTVSAAGWLLFLGHALKDSRLRRGLRQGFRALWGALSLGERG